MALTVLAFKLLIIASICSTCFSDDELNTSPFPDDFMFGVATSAYQIEGAWNEDGKTESIWDHIVHTRPDLIKDAATGDVACDSYHKIDEDVAMLKELGVNHYRFSLAWTRLLPKGTPDQISQPGVQYYKRLIKALKDNNITPLVTIFHWDTPQMFEEQGGFLNATIIKRLVDYARVCFETFGEDVKWWITFNEPKQTCEGGYGYGYFPPVRKEEGISDYICSYHLLKAHAEIYHMYQNEFKSKQKGKVSLSIDTSCYLPKTSSYADKAAVERAYAFNFGWFANPVYLGDYPEVMKVRVANRSKLEGYAQSRLPTFTEEEINYIKGTHDFFGVNTYTTSLAGSVDEPATQYQKPSRYGDMAATEESNTTWEAEVNGWAVYPLGMRLLMKYIKDTYNDPPIIITENGYADAGGLDDDGRIHYLRSYLSNVRDAIEKDGVNVIGYTFWSVMDNFEWTSGYSLKFGLYDVDFADANRTRTIKQSGKIYKKIIKNRSLEGLQ